MGKEWDGWESPASYQRWCVAWARECWRVLKPGGHLLAFGGTRTWHRMVCAIEDAGFEVRDSIHWTFGSGFPKSLDVGKAIDKAAGAEREIVGERSYGDGHVQRSVAPRFNGAEYAAGRVYREPELRTVTAPATAEATRWDGWGTALKPSHEPIVLARKPLAGTVTQTVLEHGTGALNIDACRVEWDPKGLAKDGARRQQPRHDMTGGRLVGGASGEYEGEAASPTGRWPTNTVFSHLPNCGPDDTTPCAPGCAVAELDWQSGHLKSGANPTRRRSDKFRDAYGEFAGQEQCVPARGADEGGASRFFPVFRYEAKAPASERPRLPDGTAHATVKPLALMRWLVRLVTPPGGLILDPFAGTGTTGEAAVVEGFRAILIEQEPAHAELVKARLAKPIAPVLFGEMP